MRPDGTCFTDKDVHRLLRHKGFLQLNKGEDRNEWFRCKLTDALDGGGRAAHGNAVRGSAHLEFFHAQRAKNRRRDDENIF